MQVVIRLTFVKIGKLSILLFLLIVFYKKPIKINDDLD